MKRNIFKRWKQNIQYYSELVFSSGLKSGIQQALPFWVASLVTGLVAVAYANLFNYAEELSAFLFTNFHWSIFLLTPLCFLIGWWLVKKFSPNARGSGIPQVMAAIELANPKDNKKVDKLLSLRIMVVKIASSLMMVIGGAAVGREGPTIQIAGSVFRLINKWIPNSWPKMAKQNFILTGAAAGLAAAFNTPLGGIVFAVEELAKTHIRYFRTALFSAVIIAGLTAQGILGPYLYLGFPSVSNLRYSIFLGVIATAILAGLGGSAMSKLILIALKYKSKMTPQKQIWIFVVGAAVLVAATAFFINPKMLGSGKELMTSVLFTDKKYEEWHTVILRIIGPVISFCTGAAGGIFAPSLAAGASIGAFISSIFDIAGSNANILILSGMVGFLTGVTRAPFTSAILVLEMTDRHSVIFHLMLAALASNVISIIIDPHSFYEHLKKGYLDEALMDDEELKSKVADAGIEVERVKS